MKIEFYKHNIELVDKQELLGVLDSIFLSTGEWTKRFEQKLAAYVGCQYAVGLSSGTAALELALRCCGVSADDEVITTPMSYVATASAIECCRAKPVFVDVEKDTGNINAELIEKAITSKTKAILPVHLYGHMCDMVKIRAVADKNKLKIVEDSAHCIEGERDGVKPGQKSDAACFSFYATKNITSGEGGAIACNDVKLYEWLSKARSHGVSKNAADRYVNRYEHYDMEFLGFKCNMDNIQASLLIHQLERIDTLLGTRERIAGRYDEIFNQNPNIGIMKLKPGTRHSRHLYTIMVRPCKRDEYLRKFQDAGIGVAVNYRPIHLMQYFRQKYAYKKGEYPVCEEIGDSTISIPLYPKLNDSEVEYIINSVKEITYE